MPTIRRLTPVILILLLTVLGLYVIWPRVPSRFLPRIIPLPLGHRVIIPWPLGHGVKIGSFERREMRLGLDLQGGTRLLLAASLPEGAAGNVADSMDGSIAVLRKRVDSSGIVEAEITRQGAAQISVQLPGLTPEKARSLLGRTALLQFCERAPGPNPDAQVQCDTGGTWVQATGTLGGKPVPLTSRFLKPNSYLGVDSVGNPIVYFEWQGDGPELSKQVTERLNRQPLGIFLDNQLLASPTVQGTIEDRGTITGVPLATQGDRIGARDLVVQLNAGALPVQLTVLQEQNVDATLGGDVIQRSVLAGEIGIIVVMLFMVLYYRLPGVLACFALMVYTVLSLAVFKLVPVTMTLAGIGAFVLSIGMAVDANVLVFERLKEEMRDGRSYAAALETSFRRAWPSIRDSNIATLLTTFILYFLGGGLKIPGLGSLQAPLVQGFALTLALGVLVSMFSAIVVTRSLMRVLVGTRWSRRPDWMGANLRPISEIPSAGSQPSGVQQ